MIIGESSRVDMMNVNPTKAKQLNNIRAAGETQRNQRDCMYW